MAIKISQYFEVCFLVLIVYSKQDTDIGELRQRLSECYPYYQDGSLKNDCEYFKCSVPEKCMQFNAVYHVLHFLADNKFNVRRLLLSNFLELTNLAQCLFSKV